MTEPEAKDLLAERREKLERLRAAGADPFPHDFPGREPSHTAPAPRIDSRMRSAYGVVYAALVVTTAAGVALIKV